MKFKRFEIYWLDLDTSWGYEMQKVRPVVIVSPDEVNKNLETVLVVPLTSTRRGYPTRVPLKVQGKRTYAALDQIRVVDKRRLLDKLAVLSEERAEVLCQSLRKIFTYTDDSSAPSGLSE